MIDGLILDEKASGIGQYLVELLAAYRLMFLGDSLSVWLQRSMFMDGVEVRHPGKELSGSAQRLWFEQWNLPRAMRSTGYDVVHFPDYQVPLLGAPSPLVMTVHDLAAYRVPHMFPARAGRVKRFLMAQSVKRATRIIVPSEATKRDLTEILGVDPERIDVIWHGVKRRGHPLAGRAYARPYYLAVGTVEPRKNFANLIRAYQILLSRKIDLPDLVIAGRFGWMYEETLALPEKLGVAERVKFLQYVSEDTLATLYRDAIALCYPSYYEGFGLPVIEAMRERIPVVASSEGALAEVGDQYMWRVNPTELESIAGQLEKVLSLSGEEKDRVASAHGWAEQFTWERAAQLTHQVYEKAVLGG